MKKEQQQLFKGRDQRKKGWFWVDNDYLNGYAKRFGAIGTAIYISLCRHADNETQKCFPAQEKIAEELNIAVRTVRKYLRLFESCHIVSIKRERNPMTKKWLNNVYTLLDKEEWTKPQATVAYGKPEATKDKSHRQPLPNKETHINKTHSLSDKPTDWKLEKELEKLLTDPKRHIEIIGIWIREMKLGPENKDQMQSIIKRFLRPAKLLQGYKNEDIVETINVLKNTSYLTKFTPETISKYIDEVVANKKKEGPKIQRFEKIEKPDGSIVMRPIYAKSINL